MKVYWLLPLALTHLLAPTPVPARATPASAHTTPIPTSITHAGGGDGRVEGSGPAHARLLNLTPVYPMLDVTLGVLSYVAFAVYIIMLFGGFLSRANPLQTAVAALQRQGEALLEDGAAGQNNINPALLQLLLSANTAHNHRYDLSRLLAKMNLGDHSARFDLDTPGQSQLSGLARYQDFTGHKTYGDGTTYNLLTDDRTVDRLGMFASNTERSDDRHDVPQRSAVAATPEKTLRLKTSGSGVLGPVSSEAYPSKDVNNLSDAASGYPVGRYGARGTTPGAGTYSSESGGSRPALADTLPKVLKSPPRSSIAPSHRYPGQVPGRFPGHHYHSWKQVPQWHFSTRSQSFITPQTVIRETSHVSDAVTPSSVDAPLTTVPLKQRHDPQVPSLYPVEAYQGVGAASQGHRGNHSSTVSSAPAAVRASPTLGYTVQPPILSGGGLQNFAGSTNISYPSLLYSDPTRLVNTIWRPTPSSSVTLSLDTQAQSTGGVGNLDDPKPHGARYTQLAGKFPEHGGPLGGIWTHAKRHQDLAEGLDSLPLRRPTRYRSATGKLNTPPTHHNESNSKAFSNGSTSNITSKYSRERPLISNATNVTATDNSILVNITGIHNQHGVGTKEVKAATNPTSATNVSSQRVSMNVTPEPNVFSDRFVMGTSETSEHQTEGPMPTASPASANDKRVFQNPAPDPPSPDAWRLKTHSDASGTVNKSLTHHEGRRTQNSSAGDPQTPASPTHVSRTKAPSTGGSRIQVTSVPFKGDSRTDAPFRKLSQNTSGTQTFSPTSEGTN